MDHRLFYLHNKQYSNYLENQHEDSFKKYVNYILKYSKEKGFILDVGCGTGIALEMIGKKSKRRYFGIDISSTSIQMCKTKGIDCRFYNGQKIPFKDEYFQLVGSFNVLEHTNDPISFLNEKLRVLKKGGYLIIVCPNFLSITNSYHKHTKGVWQKVKNFILLTVLLISKKNIFEKMNTIERKDFQPDDDAVNVTNPVSILLWAKKNKLIIKYWSSQSIYRQGLLNHLDNSILKIFLGSSFFVFKK